MTTTITLTLSLEQVRLLKAAISAEIIKGSGTFLSDRDVSQLGAVRWVLGEKEEAAHKELV